MSLIAFDIETVADPYLAHDKGFSEWIGAKKIDSRLKDPEKIEAAKQKVRSKYGLDPLSGAIIFASFASDVKLVDAEEYHHGEFDGINYYKAGLNGVAEAETLTAIWKIITNAINRSVRIITYNGKDFDIPFLIKRSIFNKVAKPNTVSINSLTNRYSDTNHLDVFSFFGGKWGPGGTQSEYAYRMGLTSELQSDGAQIQTWYDTMQYDKIATKCLQDTAELLNIGKEVVRWI
jgi:DNA polymerase elongation subunit (family B)